MRDDEIFLVTNGTSQDGTIFGKVCPIRRESVFFVVGHLATHHHGSFLGDL